VDKSSGEQHKTGGDNSVLKSRQGTAASQTTADIQQRAQNTGQNAGSNRDLAAPAGQNRQGAALAAGRPPAATQPGQGRSAVSSETMQQLNQEASARRQGTAHEQTFSRGAGAARFGGGRRR